ncbi:MAG: (d)CMP kinase [Bacteroidaceae bacterium]|nr:(d)CMP kinase [Bacteroidaceae bacterium]
MPEKKIIVAIDGHSSCGKSTMAKWLAKEVGYIYVDTGAMYRTVTLFALRNKFITQEGIDEEGLKASLKDVEVSFQLDPETNLPLACLNGEVVEKEIRLMEVSNNVSPIAALPFVREKLTREQQFMGEAKGIVMDGRDIGTAVFPQAELKIFVTASAQVRAQRRYDELVGKGEKNLDFDEILRNVEERDYIDSHREMNPLRQAEDALVLDNSNLTKDEQNAWLLSQFKKRTEA